MSKIVEIVDPITNKVGYYDFGTTNTSFLETARELKDLGIKRWYLCLEVKYPQLGVQNMNPMDEELTPEQVASLVLEAKDNVWFYMREVVRVPAKGAPKPYRLYTQSHTCNHLVLHSFDRCNVVSTSSDIQDYHSNSTHSTCIHIRPKQYQHSILTYQRCRLCTKCRYVKRLC